MSELTGQTVLLTGASGGIGSATAHALGNRGAHVIAHYGTNRDGAERACSEIPTERRHLVQEDLGEPGGARALWRDALAWRGRVDTVVINAAIMPSSPVEGSDEEWDTAWEQAMRINVLEPAGLIREAVSHFVAQGGGSLITLSSWAAQRGSAIPSLGAYASSKAAIRTLTQTIARNYAKDGVLAYVVAPGIVNTPMSQISADSRGGIDAVNAMLAMGEMASPEEVGRLIAWLATGECRNLSGATLDVNGASYIR